MAKATRARRKTKVEEAAEEAAAQEAIEEMESEATFASPEDRDIQLAISDNNLLTNREIDEKDIFAEGKKKFIDRNTSGTFRIYRDGAWVGTKPISYTWEKLRLDFGKNGGHFKVVAVDGNNQFAGSQSLEVAAPEIDETVIHHETKQENQLAMLELMKENQREAEAKAQSQQSGMASTFATMMQMQQQSNQMMMQMMHKSSEQTQNLLIALMTKDKDRGPDPMLTLVTTLLTQQPKETGPKAVELIKMLEDAKKDARNEAKETMRMIEDKAKKFAEDMAPESDGEESLTKTVIKSIGPVLADMMAKNAAAQQEQQALEAQRRNAGNDGLNRGFIPDANRPAIGASGQRPVQPPPRPRPVVERVPQNPVGASVSPTGVSPQVVQPVNPVENGPVDVSTSGEVLVDDRLREALFNACANDIGQALINEQPASKTAAICLAKLEKEGVPRQTVVAAFKLEDFYAYAEKFGLPDIAKPWLKEFHESIAKQASQKPVRPSANTGTATRVDGGNGNGPSPASNGAKPPVAAQRSQATRPGPARQPRERAKDL